MEQKCKITTTLYEQLESEKRRNEKFFAAKLLKAGQEYTALQKRFTALEAQLAQSQEQTLHLTERVRQYEEEAERERTKENERVRIGMDVG